MNPAHHSPERRWPVLALVVVVVVVVGIVAGTRGTSAPPASALTAPSALVGPPDAESSAWYCTGQTTAAGVAPGFLVLTNTTGAPSTATITSVSDGGASERTVVAVPAHGVVAPSLPSPLVGLVAGPHRDRLRRRGRRVAGGARFVGLVPGSVPEHHVVHLVLSRRVDRRLRRARTSRC